jgi:metallo-beta-lactamase family protein
MLSKNKYSIIMKISFHGAAQTVTGSKHLLQLESGKKILLDCGMFQGMGKETMNLNSNWGFDPIAIDYVILSHAHIDHSGLLPRLVKDGYNGRIYCTPPTADLLQIMLPDSAHVMASDVQFINKRRREEGKSPIEPLYNEEDAAEVLNRLVLVDYEQEHAIDKSLQLLYTDCGHILGSAAVNLRINDEGKETTLTFSGDVGRYRDMILRSPQAFPQADYIILESTYGNKLHEGNIQTEEELLKYLNHTCIEKKGKLIIPAFSVGRTQEVLFMLNRLELEGRLPDLQYFVDSPLSIKATGIIKKHPECFNKSVQKLLKRDNDVFKFKGLKFIESVEESMQLNLMKEPAVIISASGMAEAGRIKHHIANNISNPANTILITGYCEPESLGGKLRAGADKVNIFGRSYEVKAEVALLESLSAHGDYEDLCQWLACQDPREVSKLFLVHGEPEVQEAFKERLIRKGFTDVEIPSLHQSFGLK